MNRSHISVAVVSFVASLAVQFVMTPRVALAADGGGGVSEVVRARRFEVVDAKGRTRAMLGMTPGGTLKLTLDDEGGTTRARLVLGTDENPWLMLDDAKGKTRASLTLLPTSGRPLLWMDGPTKSLPELP